MTVTGVLFIVLNALMKKLSHEMDPWLVGFLRYSIGALVMLVSTVRLGMRALFGGASGIAVALGALAAIIVGARGRLKRAPGSKGPRALSVTT